jgi:pimeloyl-ACP methyl ester carboxylesterase
MPIISLLPAEFGIIALDIRGRGQSWGSPGPYDLKTIADDAAICMDRFEIPSAPVAGYSMGAWIAALLAQRHPAKAERLILLDGGFPIEFDRNLDTEDILNQVVGPAITRLAMTFDTLGSYLEFWRQHPALVGRWRSDFDEAFAYDVHQVDGTWRPRANRDAVVQGASDYLFDADTIRAGSDTATHTKLLLVDHGMTDKPGGHVPMATAVEAAKKNPNIELRPLENLNHYTLMFGGGSASVASAIMGTE